MAKPTIQIFALGGTIAMVPDSDGGARPALSAVDLVKAAPGINEIATIESHDFRQFASANLSFSDLVELAIEVSACFAAGGDGVVVTQGTDSLEETAFALDLMTKGGCVVFTGAMRNAGIEDSDGPDNLIDAIAVSAAIGESLGGAIVVMNGEVHAASEVRKTHTSSLGAFTSFEKGPLGKVSSARLEWHRAQPQIPYIPPGSLGASARVAYYSAVLDDEISTLQSIADGQYDGLVLAAFGGGHMPEASVELLGRMAQKMPVVLASRTGAGRVLEDVYAYKGSEMDLISKGLIPAGSLDGPKSRVFLKLAVSAGWSTVDIRAAFAKF